MKLFSKIIRKASFHHHNWSEKQPTRPIVLIQSDDWGRVGLLNVALLEKLKLTGASVGCSPWDYYGAESAEDLQILGEALRKVNDADGSVACMTANIIMANADLSRMCTENFSTFRALPIHAGFPSPWKSWDIISEYKKLINDGVLYPALHGFTHFSPDVMLQSWHDKGDLGYRSRLLFKHGVPYLASFTPEFNFALLRRYKNGECFASESEQKKWIKKGVDLFYECFDFMPVATCAPGYRANHVTHKLWERYGIQVAQDASRNVACKKGGLLFISRNVFFEPVLNYKNIDKVINDAFLQAKAAVRKGNMIVICTHSINYIQSHLEKRDDCLQALIRLLHKLLHEFPNLRFANDEIVLHNWLSNDETWFTNSSFKVKWRRLNE